jgi:hypothetical protein
MLLKVDQKIVPLVYSACKLTAADAESLALMLFPSKHSENETLNMDCDGNAAWSSTQ